MLIYDFTNIFHRLDVRRIETKKLLSYNSCTRMIREPSDFDEIRKEFFMKKTYILDTNVLIQSPFAIETFQDNDLVIPLVVLEELDNLKKADGEKGFNARTAVRILEKYRNEGNLLERVPLPGGGTIRVEPNFVNVELPPDLPEDKADNRIL